MGSDWAGLTDGEREPYVAAAKDATDDLWVCTRVWEAWSVGTMTECDFRRASHDDDVVNDVAAAAYAAGATLRSRAEAAEQRAEAAEADHVRARDLLAECEAALANVRTMHKGERANRLAAERRAEALAAELAQARDERDEAAAAATAGAAAVIARTAQAEAESLRAELEQARADARVLLAEFYSADMAGNGDFFGFIGVLIQAGFTATELHTVRHLSVANGDTAALLTVIRRALGGAA